MIRFGPFRLDPAAATLSRGDVGVHAQPRVIALIGFLAARADRVVSREELLAGVWPDVHVSDDALHQLIKRARGALGDDAAAPRYIETVPRRGWRFVAPVERPVPSSASAGLFGRDALLRELLAELSQGPGLWTLHGPGGVGKTSLARALSLAWEGPVRVVTLSSLRDRAGVVEAMASALRLQLGNMALDTISAVCGERLRALGDALLWLDNAEHLPPDGLRSLDDWQGGGLRVLVTSRHRLGRAEEQVRAVPPLSPAAARQLWESVRGGSCEDPHLARLLDRLDHLPLAIRLTAARGRLLNSAELLARVEAGARDVTTAASGVVAESRQDSLETSIAWSWELLSGQAREDLARLSVIEDRFDLDDAAALLGEGALDRLDQLEQRALLQILPGEDGTHFQLLDAVRRFAARVGGAAAGAAAAAWDDHVVTLADALLARFRHRGQQADLARLVRLLPALHRARERARAPATRVLRAAGLAARIQDWTGPGVLALPALDQAATQLGEVPAHAQATFLHHQAVVVSNTGDVLRGVALSERACALLGPDASLEERCTLWTHLGGQISTRGREAEAIALLTPLWQEAEAQGARFLAVQVGAQLANGLYRAGRLDEGIAVARRAMQLAEQEGCGYLLPSIQSNLAVYLIQRGAFTEAEILLHRAVEASRDSGRLERENLALSQLAHLAHYAGWPDRARAAAERAMPGAMTLRATFNASILVPVLGAVALIEGRATEARRLFGQALLDYAAARGEAYRGAVLFNLALAVWLEGDLDAARPMLREARGLISPRRTPEVHLCCEAFLAIATGGQEPRREDLPRSSAIVHVALVLEATHALINDQQSSTERAMVLAHLREARPPERPPAARWAEVAAAAQLLAQALSRDPASRQYPTA